MGMVGIETKFPRDYTNKLYVAWRNMRRRCSSPKSPDYPYYGGRGITVCKDWNEYANFEQWALENNHDDSLTLDRIDANKNYSPDNCRWASRLIQSRNTRGVRKDSTTKIRGVAKHGNKYRADIRLNGKRKYLGLYATKEQAGMAYDKYVLDNKLEHTRNYI